MTVAAALLPALVTALGLWLEATREAPSGFDRWWVIPLPLLLTVAGVIWGRRRESRGVLLRLAPLWMAPLTLVFPWVTTPGLGYGSYSQGGFAFFLGWLRRYPSLGPFNLDVLLGILCVIACAGVPLAYALHTLARGAPLRRLTRVLYLLVLVPPYGAVIVYLDAMTLLTAAGQASSRIAGLDLAGGALLRLMAFLALLAEVLTDYRAPRSAAQTEDGQTSASQ